MLNNICQPGNRKLAAFFTSIGIYFLLMSLVIITHKLENLSLESFAVSLAAGIMAISYGYYASNAYVAGKTGPALGSHYKETEAENASQLRSVQ